MSVPSAKMATTCEKPNFETERTSSSPLSPPRAYSTGKVMSRSTSSGDSSGATVLIWTCTGVVSGKASSGRRVAERIPMTIRSPASKSTTNRFFRLKSMRALSIGRLLVGRCDQSQHPAPMEPFMISVFSRKAPVVTTS